MENTNSQRDNTTGTAVNKPSAFNWGHKIALVYIGFVLFMVGLVVMAFQQKFDLVADDYYEQEIAYQGRIDQMDNARSRNMEVSFAQSDAQMTVRFPSPSTQVKIHFFRPSNKTMDLLQEAAQVDSTLGIPAEKLSSGKYIAKVEWQANGETYYQEKTVLIN